MDYFASELIKKKNERIKQLEEENERLKMKYENTGAVFNRQVMQEKIEKYEEVLQFYAFEVASLNEDGTKAKRVLGYSY